MNASYLHASYLLSSLVDTQTWGRALGAHLVAGDVIALIGDLGAGKTTLTQALACGMGIIEPVTSPTFALAQEYPGRLPLFHFDPYRLDSPEAFADIGFEEYFKRGGVMVVEWADKIDMLLPTERLTLTLSEESASEDGGDAARLVNADAVGERYVGLLTDLNTQPDIASLLRFSE